MPALCALIFKCVDCKHIEGRYSVDAVLKTVIMQTHSNRSDVRKQNSFVVATTQSYVIPLKVMCYKKVMNCNSNMSDNDSGIY